MIVSNTYVICTIINNLVCVTSIILTILICCLLSIILFHSKENNLFALYMIFYSWFSCFNIYYGFSCSLSLIFKERLVYPRYIL